MVRPTPVLLLLTACGPGLISVTPGDVAQVPPMVVVAGAADEAPRPMRREEGPFAAPTALWVQGGALAVLDSGGAHLRTGVDAFAPLPVGTPEAPAAVAAVTSIAPRGDGVLLSSPQGLFHDRDGRLLRSPLSDGFAMDAVRAVDVVGSGGGEVLWVTTDEVVRVARGRREALTLADAAESGALQVVVGEGEARALVVQGASLYRVDAAAKTVTVLARGVAQVTGFTRGPSGEVLLGTAEGLLSVGADGVVTRRTLAAEGAAAAPVVGVTRAGAATLIATSTQVLQAVGATTVVLADVAAPKAHALARTGDGDTWLVDGAALVRLTSQVDPTAPSFERDVKPFMAAHCASCHVSGASYAPVIDFERYGVAKTYAARTVARLKDTAAPMPPASTEVLTPAQYDVVVRWAQEGMLP